MPPIFVKNVFHNHWKNEKGKLTAFELMPAHGQVESLHSSGRRPGGQESVQTRLKKLDSLRDQGVITEEEYAAKRRSLLDKL